MAANDFEISIEYSQEALQRGLRDLVKRTGISEGAAVRRVAGRIARGAQRGTAIASRAEINQVMRRPLTRSSKVRYTKRRKVAKPVKNEEWKGTFAAVLYVWLKRQGGGKAKTRAGFYSGVKRMVGKRLRNVGFHRRGYQPAIDFFGAADLGSGGTRLSQLQGNRKVRKSRGKYQGTATFKRRVGEVEASWTNNALGVDDRNPTVLNTASRGEIGVLTRDIKKRFLRDGKAAGFTVSQR